jgi:hypothetical protein
MDLATIALVFAAIGGVIMVTVRLTGRPRPPTWLAIGHGGMAAFGVGLLAGEWAVLPDLARISLGIFCLAILGGATLFLGFHLRNRPLPIPLMLAHGLTALTGLTLLIIALVRTAEPGKLPFPTPPREPPVQEQPIKEQPAPVPPISPAQP